MKPYEGSYRGNAIEPHIHIETHRNITKSTLPGRPKFLPLHLPFLMVLAAPERLGLTGTPFDLGMPGKPNKDR